MQRFGVGWDGRAPSVSLSGRLGQPRLAGVWLWPRRPMMMMMDVCIARCGSAAAILSVCEVSRDDCAILGVAECVEEGSSDSRRPSECTTIQGARQSLVWSDQSVRLHEEGEIASVIRVISRPFRSIRASSWFWFWKDVGHFSIEARLFSAGVESSCHLPASSRGRASSTGETRKVVRLGNVYLLPVNTICLNATNRPSTRLRPLLSTWCRLPPPRAAV